MKKSIIKIMALALVAVMMCAVLVSCDAPNSDPDKALEALKENGVTWAGKDTVIIPVALRVLGVDGIDCVVSGTGKIDDEFATITIIYFDEADDAKEAMETVQKYADDKKDDDAKDSEWVFKQSGKMIWYGTKNAVKAAK